MRPALRQPSLPHLLAGVFAASTVVGIALAAWRGERLMASLWLAQAVLFAGGLALAWRWGRRHRAAHRQLERVTGELREAIATAEQAKRSQGQFLANMSHELRTPFQGVLGMLQLLEQTQVDAVQRDLLRTAQHSATHLLALLNDILDVSAIEAGRLELREAPLDLHRLVGDVQQLMQVQAAARGLRLQVELSPALPQWVRGDATRIKQILFNLLGNALKFTPQGQVRLLAEPMPFADGRDMLRFEVADTGVGMDAATLARLFRRFELGDPTLSRRAGGAGLGLEISRTLARLMHGDISVTSTPGRGSVFVVMVDVPACEPPAQDAQATQPGSGVPRASRPLRVVLADDNAVNRKYLGLLLGQMGHHVVHCAHGQEAVDQVRRDDHDVVLMDLHMPVLDGLAATRAIRRLPGRDGALPIYALTADTAERTHALAREAGCTAVLVKPVDTRQLAHLLAAVQPAPPGSAMAPWSHTVPDGGGDTEPAESVPATLPPPLSTRFEDLGRQLPQQELPGLLDMFFDDRTRTIADLEQALEAGTPGQVAQAAHKLKGAARLLGFRRIAHVAEQIERSVERGRPHELPRLREALRDSVETTRGAVGTAA